jgi:hypothetical protein
VIEVLLLLAAIAVVWWLVSAAFSLLAFWVISRALRRK